MELKTKAFWVVIILVVGASVGSLITTLLSNRSLGGGYAPQNFGTSVYFTTTTDHVLLPGNSAPVRVDQYGRLLITN